MENQTTLPIDYDGKTIDEQAVLSVMTAQLPETLRLMNADSICTEYLFGPDALVQDEDLPEENVYQAFDAILAAMVAEGLANEGDMFGLKVYGLTDAGIAKAGF